MTQNSVDDSIIRRATDIDYPILSEIAFRSKAHWGYNATFMAACRDDLTITSERASDQLIYVLEQNGTLIGFYGLRITGTLADLTNLFVDPSVIGFGYGKQLWHHALATAQAQRIECIVIESDPHAEAFYRAMGAVRVGDVPSSVFPDRVLPLMHFSISSTSK